MSGKNYEGRLEKMEAEINEYVAQLAKAKERIWELEKEKAQAYRIVAAAKGNTETAEAERDAASATSDERSKTILKWYKKYAQMMDERDAARADLNESKRYVDVLERDRKVLRGALRQCDVISEKLCEFEDDYQSQCNIAEELQNAIAAALLGDKEDSDEAQKAE